MMDEDESNGRATSSSKKEIWEYDNFFFLYMRDIIFGDWCLRIINYWLFISFLGLWGLRFECPNWWEVGCRMAMRLECQYVIIG